MAVSAVGDFLVFLRRVCCNHTVQHRLTEHRWLKTLLTIVSGTDHKGEVCLLACKVLMLLVALVCAFACLFTDLACLSVFVALFSSLFVSLRGSLIHRFCCRIVLAVHIFKTICSFMDSVCVKCVH